MDWVLGFHGSARGLPYLVRVSAPGFRSVVRENIGLEVAQDIRIDFVLPPGDTQQTVTVNEEAPLVDATSAVLGGTAQKAYRRRSMGTAANNCWQ